MTAITDAIVLVNYIYDIEKVTYESIQAALSLITKPRDSAMPSSKWVLERHLLKSCLDRKTERSSTSTNTISLQPILIFCLFPHFFL